VKRTPLRRAGVKTRAWETTRRKLKPRFERAGITSCEFGFEGCWRRNGLSFAHGDKRRYLDQGELEVAALACIPCHNKLELMPRDKMRFEVACAIAKRICQP
jgi:hypothetical protein